MKYVLLKDIEDLATRGEIVNLVSFEDPYVNVGTDDDRAFFMVNRYEIFPILIPIMYPTPQRNPHCKCSHNPMAQMVCEFGHMTECHYPYTCADAGCSHLSRYYLADGEAEALIKIAVLRLISGKLPPYSLDEKTDIQVDPNPKSLLRRCTLLEDVNAENGSMSIAAGTSVVILNDTGSGLIVQTEDEQSSAFVQWSQVETEPTNYIVFFLTDERYLHLFLTGITRPSTIQELALEKAERVYPGSDLGSKLVGWKEWYIDVPAHRTDEEPGKYETT